MNEKRFLEISKKFEIFEKQRIRNLKKLNSHNIFSILRMEDFEIRHSNFLAWLFDKSTNGEIGYQFLKKFISKLKNDTDKFNNLNINEFFKSNYEVKRELKYKDIMIVNDTYKKALVIENKFYSSERGNQLFRYFDDVTTGSEYAGYDKYFIYLTLNGVLPERESDRNYWIPFSYGTICELLKGFTDKSKNLSANIKLILENYIEILEYKLEKEMNIIDEYRKLYNNYPELIDDFIKYIPNNERRMGILRECIDNAPSCIYESGNKNSWITFNNIDILKLLSENNLPQDTFCFEILQRDKGNTITFRIIVNHCDNETNLNFVKKIRQKPEKDTDNNTSNIKYIALEQVLSQQDTKKDTEAEIHESLAEKTESLLNNPDSKYFQIVELIKKEYFGV